jgi:hypothetical protein
MPELRLQRGDALIEPVELAGGRYRPCRALAGAAASLLCQMSNSRLTVASSSWSASRARLRAFFAFFDVMKIRLKLFHVTIAHVVAAVCGYVLIGEGAAELGVGRLRPVALLADPYFVLFRSFSCLLSSAEQANTPFFVYFVTFLGW